MPITDSGEADQATWRTGWGKWLDKLEQIWHPLRNVFEEEEMVQASLSMRKIEEILRLKFEIGLTHRAIAKSCGVSTSTVSEYVTHAKAAGLSWPLPEELTAEQLEARLYPDKGGSRRKVPQPDWPFIHKELKRKGVTLSLLWVEYRQEHPDGYGYSQFCQHYREWKQPLNPIMRQKHKAGEKLFVDYAGQTMAVVDPETGEIREAQVFVATLGASNYTYTEAHWTQSLPNWIAAHVRALEFLGGVPEIVVPDILLCKALHKRFYVKSFVM